MAPPKSNGLTRILIGGTSYISVQDMLDFLAARATLTLEGLRTRGLPLGDTEFLRGQSFEQEILKHAIQPPQVS